jgi:phage shock protein PspC (stress-responsive transcriptional regulator)
MTRSRRNRMLSGVCAGIANQIGIGAFWVRLLFVTAAVIIPGVSLITMVALYVLMALVLPWDDEVARYR